MDVQYYRRLLRETFARRTVVVVGVSRARLHPIVEGLLSVGAEGAFAVSCNDDGDEPTKCPRSRWWSFRIVARDHQELHDQFDLALGEPPALLVQHLDDFDPGRDAWVIDTRNLPGSHLLGRQRFGWRRPQWATVEDKTLVEETWRRAGVAHAPSIVVEARPEPVLCAAARLDAGSGTVWAADALAGLHSGCDGTRWVRGEEQTAAAMRSLLPRSGRLRVMPFLEGLPCSIHALVCGTSVVALRPMELVVLRRPDGRFVFAGTSTLWDCPADAAGELRDTVRRLGTTLATTVGYRGGFTVDGVLTASGFLPTEINARLGSGLNLNETLPELQFFLLNRLLQEDPSLDLRPVYLEAALNEALSQGRSGRAKVPLIGRARSYSTIELGRPHGDWEIVQDPCAAVAQVQIRASDKGDQAAFLPDETVFQGASLAPAAVTAFELTEKALAVDIGSLTAATEYR